jgi:hypothetical protein
MRKIMLLFTAAMLAACSDVQPPLPQLPQPWPRLDPPQIYHVPFDVGAVGDGIQILFEVDGKEAGTLSGFLNEDDCLLTLRGYAESRKPPVKIVYSDGTSFGNSLTRVRCVNVWPDPSLNVPHDQYGLTMKVFGEFKG